MDVPILLWWLAMLPWAPAEALAAATGLTVPTINRQLGQYSQQEWACYRMIGRGTRAKRLWNLASAGLEQLFSLDHVHGEYGGPDGHYHYPLYPHISTHRHVPWHRGTTGLELLYSRCQAHLCFYDVAFRLFEEATPDWLELVGDGNPRLKSWHPIRRGRLIEVVAVYEDDCAEYVVVFLWVGRQLRPRLMLEKWGRMFSRLRWTSRAEEMEKFRDPHIDQPDPNYDPRPQPSCFAVIGEDEYAVRQAMELLPRHGYLQESAFSFWVAGAPCRKLEESGRVWPNADFIYEPFEDIPVGEPEETALPEGNNPDAPPYPAVLSKVLTYRIIGLAEEWDALREEDAADLLDTNIALARVAFQELVAAGLLERVEHWHYMTDKAMKWVAAKDRVSVTTLRHRSGSYLDESMERHHHNLEHNRGMIEIVRLLKKQGIRVYGGFRGVRNFPGLTQIQPDGLLYAEGPWGRCLYLLEYERRATHPEQITTKLRTFRRAASLGVRFRVIWITETRRAAERFLRRAKGLDAMVATIDELRNGPIAGQETIWRSDAGENVELKPL